MPALKKYLWVISISLCYWLFLLVSEIFHLMPINKVTQISAISEFISHLIMIYFATSIYKNCLLMERKFAYWLLFISVAIFINDLIFYLLVYFKENYSMIIPSINEIFFAIAHSMWIIPLILMLSTMIMKHMINKRIFYRRFCLLLLIDFIAIYFFLTSIEYVFGASSWESSNLIIGSIVEIIVVAMSIFCLIYSTGIGVSSVLVGFVILISGDFMLTYSYLTQITSIAPYGELFWFLGLIFISSGVLFLKYDKNHRLGDWLRKFSAVRSHISFGTFVISAINILPFFILLYYFLPVDKAIFAILPPVIMITSVVMVIFSSIIGIKIERHFEQIAHNIEDLMLDKKSIVKYDFFIDEFVFLQKFINDIYDLKEERDRATKEIGKIAAQVAHDMRSPLLAVDSFFHLIEKKLDESERIFGNRAISRLNDIAWSLLSKYKKKEENTSIGDSYVFLSSCVQEILSEKRMEYAKKSIEFVFLFEPANAFCLVYTNAMNLKRMLSNIINNAVNAILPREGLIEVQLKDNIFGRSITIKDNGCGMKQEVLNDIIESARNEKGKTNLGLPHAVKFLESIGGKLEMESIEGKGTVVSASLPYCEAPAWCLNHYQVSNDELLLIIDDSQSVHDVWDEMLKKVPDVKYQHLYTPDEASDFFKKHNKKSSKKLVIFCDYEFFNANKNGLDVLTSAPDYAVKFLVTSHLYNPKIMQAAIEKGFNILPKDLAPYFRLNKSLPKDRQDEVRLIFIDNEKGNTDDWQFFADHYKVNIVTYNVVADFLKDADRFSRHIPIYIDLDLGEKRNGIDYAKDIYALGFKTIYIATGAVDDRLNKADYPWITDILDKKPPF